jgi:ferritin
MIGKKMEDALNAQIKAELESAYLYLSMAACFHNAGLDGMAQWMKAQTQEELEHAMRLFEHIVDRAGRPVVPAISEPKQDWDTPLQAFQDAYKHEQYITGRINDLVQIAADEKDNAAGVMLQWFVTEQVEEEDSVAKIVQWLERVGDSGNGLVMLDVQLGKRE